ncbi:MAG: hypothetical protein EHM16_10615 [Betaproteobacteria bacterium]|nr:MAG: hypothetical protein EHM16_10615 [Betaproteobacteria bacterium]
MTLEAKGLPTAVIVTSEFTLEAATQRDALGMTGLDAVVIRHPLSSLTATEIAGRIADAVPQIESVWLTGKAAS